MNFRSKVHHMWFDVTCPEDAVQFHARELDAHCFLFLRKQVTEARGFSQETVAKHLLLCST